MSIKQWLELDVDKAENMDKLQKELMNIKYIHKHAKSENFADIAVLDEVLTRLRQNDLAVSFIMSNKQMYELVLIGTGKWRMPDKSGKLSLYKIIGKTECNSIYECIAKATLCLYKFIQENKRE